MEKILVISDSHRDDETLERINEKFKDIPIKIHAGDTALPYDDPMIRDYYKVKGNHDFLPGFPLMQILVLNGVRTLLLHGHLHGIYGGYDEIIPIAKKNNCKLIIHGHTHIPHVETIDGILCLNPGSLMFNRGSYGYGTYCLLTIQDDSSMEYHFYHHEDDTEVTDYVLEDGQKWLNTLKQFVTDGTY